MHSTAGKCAHTYTYNGMHVHITMDRISTFKLAESVSSFTAQAFSTHCFIGSDSVTNCWFLNATNRRAKASQAAVDSTVDAAPTSSSPSSSTNDVGTTSNTWPTRPSKYDESALQI